MVIANCYTLIVRRKQDTHTDTVRLHETNLPCNLQRQHGQSPFSNRAHGAGSENQTDRLTSLAHSARGQTCFLFTSDWILLHRLQKCFTSSGLGYILASPVITQRCITRRFLFHLRSPAFCSSEVCFVSNMDQLQRREIDRIMA